MSSAWPLSAPADPLFEVLGDPARALLRVSVRGHWNVDAVHRLEAARMAVVEQMVAQGCNPEHLLSLVDAREQGAQSQEVLAAFQASLVKPGMRSLRGAVLVASALYKLQVRRSAMDEYQVFDEEQPAMEWLTTGRRPAGH